MLFVPLLDRFLACVSNDVPKIEQRLKTQTWRL